MGAECLPLPATSRRVVATIHTRQKGKIAVGLYLDAEIINKLIEDLLQTGLYTAQYRGLLLAGIDAKYTAALTNRTSDLNQIRSDLVDMNQVRSLRSGEVPLATWLGNAASILKVSGRSEHRKFEEQQNNVIRASKSHLQANPESFFGFVPPLPNNYVKRQLVFNALEVMLRKAKGKYVGVFGLPGTGKTVLVSGLIKTSVAVHESFPGGVYWVYGASNETGNARISCQRQLYLQLNRDSNEFQVESWQEGLLQLQRASERSLAGMRPLVVVDDPPGADILPALQFSESALLLIICSNRSILDAKSVPKESVLNLVQMDKDEALELLRLWTEDELDKKRMPDAAIQMAELVGYHPLALAMAGAIVRVSITPQVAWQDLLDALRAEKIDVSHPVDDYPTADLSLVFRAALEALPLNLRARFSDLAMFPKDARISLEYMYRLWVPEEPRSIRQHVQTLLRRAMVQETGNETFVLHSLLRLYLRHSVDNFANCFQTVVSNIFPGVQAIRMAAQWGDLRAVESLIQGGENLNAADQHGFTALHVAAEFGHQQIVMALIDAGAQPNQASADGHTAIWVAAQNGHLETVRLLLTLGADPNAQNQEGFSPLHVAGQKRTVPMGPDFVPPSSQRNHVEVVSLLLSRGARVSLANSGQKSALYVAVRAGHSDVVRNLLLHAPLKDQETDPAETPLRMASRRGYTDIMRLLIDSGADVNWASPDDGATALHFACFYGQAAAVAILNDAGAKLNSRSRDGSTPLHVAAQEGHLEAVRAILAAGALVNELNSGRFTPLHSAAQHGHAGIVRALIEAGADSNLRSVELYTPLHLAVQAFDFDTVDALVRGHAQLNLHQRDGLAALHLAIIFRSRKTKSRQTTTTLSMSEAGFQFSGWIPPIVERLIEAHADVNLSGRDGMTPLHVAAQLDDDTSAAKLLAAGAKVDICDHNGQTALDLARKEKRTKIVALFE
jgi:ankyrin repeat protein